MEKPGFGPGTGKLRATSGANRSAVHSSHAEASITGYDWLEQCSKRANVVQDLDSARVPARSTVGAAAVLATKPAGIEALAAENRRLKQAVECRELQKRKKLILKQQKLLERLQVKRALQLASAEHVELKQFAKAVSRLCAAAATVVHTDTQIQATMLSSSKLL